MSNTENIPENITENILNTVIEDYIPTGRQNRPGGFNPARYITIHETGNPAVTATARAHAQWLKSTDEFVSWHFTVDDEEIYAHLPVRETAYHAGDNTGNRESVGIEICVNEGGDFIKALNRAARLTAALMRDYGIAEDGLRRHFDWSGKKCPARLLSGDSGGWEGFLERVKADAPSRKAPPHWVEPFLAELIRLKVIDTPEAWLPLAAPLSKGQALALVAKAINSVSPKRADRGESKL